ncbi:MAG: DUF2281 domain-containing protein [Methylovulum sp.]|uniref:DUF2281 domain-containing protein n=1 Tax=Methylovulum sp. TaxID=1916980 RepID=UPI00262EECDB|nr:DUF2281 domain-containing protein [Methylovulum sp.]MDD2725309.1 DUF2281 domain-containing protein [Methylovulum sp.]MDD5125114.1 DUF2281 domain-containing protein [Methylovulum sp.]
MTLSPQEITQQLLMLPEQEQQEALDFIEFLHSKSTQKLAKTTVSQSASQTLAGVLEGQAAISDDKTVSPIYQAFEQAGLIGCIESDAQLSTTYKEKLDFSFKHGVTE